MREPKTNDPKVKELRERTAAGMKECIDALRESSGDVERAIDIILKNTVVKYGIPM